jgi:ATP-binding cassette subfamily G (WHITE) protein 2 (SNQ2)
MLADRKPVGTHSGAVYINKAPRTKFTNRTSAYVLQDDVHVGSLTVEETLYYAAWVRMPEGTTEEELRARVTMLLQLLDMEHIRISIVGDSMTKGWSAQRNLSLFFFVVSMHNFAVFK